MKGGHNSACRDRISDEMKKDGDTGDLEKAAAFMLAHEDPEIASSTYDVISQYLPGYRAYWIIYGDI